jgi:hypothetical protein
MRCQSFRHQAGDRHRDDIVTASPAPYTEAAAPGDPGAVSQKRQRAPCPIMSPDVLDVDWIPQVSARGWLITTRDSMIIQNRNEIAAVRENKAKMVANDSK